MIQGAEEPDPRLQQIFVQSASALADEPFLGRFALKLEFQRRTRYWRRGLIWAAWMGLLVYLTPVVTAMTLGLTEWISAAIMSPWTWVLSLPLGLWAMQRSRVRA